MENSEEGANKLVKKEAVDYSLVLSEIYYRVSNSENEFPESAFDDLVREVEGILSENRFTNGISGVKYSVAQHYYLYSKYNSVFKILQSGSRAVFNYGVFARDFYPKSTEQKIMIDAEKKDLLSELENLRAKPKEEHYTSQETTIRNIEKMVETFNFKYEIYNISESHYKVKYVSSDFEQVKRFSLFFNWYLASLTTFEVFNFLQFHLNDSFAGNFVEFSDFIEKTISGDRHKIISLNLLNTLNSEIKKMGKVKRKEIEFPSNVPVVEKLDWLGTQKELAELFIELNRKGFLTEIPKNLPDHFKGANTINQILKPAIDPSTYKPTYEQVYTSEYKSRFSGILKSKKK